jgi:hypothetical protein
MDQQVKALTRFIESSQTTITASFLSTGFGVLLGLDICVVLCVNGLLFGVLSMIDFGVYLKEKHKDA